MTVDSGACDHVVNPSVLPANLKGTIKTTKAVAEGITYGSASGHPLPNLGEVEVGAITEDGVSVDLVMQCVGVTKPLLAVRKMCSAGNRVIFDSEGSYIENKATGATTPIREEEGTYAVWLWVLVPDGARETTAGNSFSQLSEVEEVAEDAEVVFESGFTRHA